MEYRREARSPVAVSLCAVRAALCAHERDRSVRAGWEIMTRGAGWQRLALVEMRLEDAHGGGGAGARYEGAAQALLAVLETEPGLKWHDGIVPYRKFSDLKLNTPNLVYLRCRRMFYDFCT